MLKKCLAALALSGALVATAPAQDAKTVLADSAKAMGVTENFGSVRFDGSGLNYQFGQSYDVKSPWPKFNVTKYQRTIDFDAGASGQNMTRTQAENPPRGGGPQPIIGEQAANTIIGEKQPWETQFEMWMTPWSFLKGAMAAPDATAAAKTEGGKKYTVVTYTPEKDKKYKISGFIDDQNLVAKIETQIDVPLLGDTPVNAVFTDYKDNHGLKYPGKIVETEGGYPVLDLNVTGAAKNVIAGLIPPAATAAADPIVDEQLIADDVYYFTGGTHHSVILGFNDYTIVFEGPLDEERSSAVISEVKKLYFNKPIRYLINSHHHFDHSGGIRTYAAEGATIVTQMENKAYYEKVFTQPHTLIPDKLSQSKKKALVEGVLDKRVFTDGTHTLELYRITNSGHDGAMLIGYIPKEKIVIEADLYTAPVVQPGVTAEPAAGEKDKDKAAAAPPPPNPYTVSLVDNLNRLKLDYERIIGLHGREATKEELLKAAGKAPATPAAPAAR